MTEWNRLNDIAITPFYMKKPVIPAD